MTASKSLTMETASASTSATLGFVDDLPVTLGPVTIRLQVQVVDDAPLEVLLGRPFFDRMNCTETSRLGGEYEICIRDPKTGVRYAFATSLRLRKTPPALPTALEARSGSSSPSVDDLVVAEAPIFNSLVSQDSEVNDESPGPLLCLSLSPPVLPALQCCVQIKRDGGFAGD